MIKIKGSVYESFYDKLYTPDLKIRFIEENYYNSKDTKTSILHMFKKSADIEKSFNKDLCILNAKEVLELAKRLDYKTLNTMHSAFSYYSHYVDWCILNKERGSYENNMNEVSIFMKTQDLSQFLSKINLENRYLTKEEVYDLVDNLVNYQDKAYILGIYEGIGGREMYELRSLKIGNVDFETNMVKLTDYDGEQYYTREKLITDKLKTILAYANDVEEYYTANGSPNAKDQLLAKSPYILRPTSRVSSEGQMMKYGTFSQKMVSIRKYIDYKYISISSIFDSGAMNRALEIAKKMGLDNPNDEIFNLVGDKSEYNLSYNVVYRLRQKYRTIIGERFFK